MSLQDAAIESNSDSESNNGPKLSDMKSIPSAIAILKKPVVLIVGAGLGGLTLGLLLQRAGIEFFIFERAPKVRPLGASMTLSANILPVFEQLGLLEEIKKFSYELSTLHMYEESMKYIGAFDGKAFIEMTGYQTQVFARHELYDLLVSKIEPSRFLMNKKVLSTQQNLEGVMVRTADNGLYHGDILVGADGAYSAVRSSLFKELEKKGLLPAEDKEEMSIAYLSLVGTTKPLSTEKYPDVGEECCHFSTVLAKGQPHSWTTVTLPNKRISWMVWIQVTKEEGEDMMFRNSDWGTLAHRELIEQVRHYPVKNGGTLGEIIDATESDLVSKVFIEEKLFQTWNHGRTVLMGDAVAAMQDAVILANSIYEMVDPTYENIHAALTEYRTQRFKWAEIQVDLGKVLAKLMFGQKWTERLLRKIIYNLPKWAQTQSHMRMAAYRPIINFLPPPPHRANVKLLPQKPSERYAKEQADRDSSATNDASTPVIAL
ncbi:hypothetical protein BG004_006466 [Podila humilis]|nr:hypothetical protein BG004_006466 [Podila humilis]